MKPLIIAHANCQDGMFAAYYTALGLSAPYGQNHEDDFLDGFDFVQADYNHDVPELTGRDVYIVDFSYPPEKLIPASKNANKVVIIDHHKTAIEKWSGVDLSGTNIETVFSLMHCGTSLVWEYFFKNEEPPAVIKLVQDYDLWTHENPDSRAFHRAIYDDGVIQTWDFKRLRLLIGLKDKTIAEGKVLLKARANSIKNIIAKNAVETWFAGHLVYIAPCPYEFASDVGNELAMGRAFSITYDDQFKLNIRKYSLRSNKLTGIDVSELAKQFGGGGHREAAGFIVPSPTPIQFIPGC